MIVTTETNDVSTGGFYCTSDHPFSPGERLNCEVMIPAKGAVPGRAMVMNCRVKVLRVEIKGLEPGFGIACQFEDRCIAVG